jgi:hypothetical protein
MEHGFARSTAAVWQSVRRPRRAQPESIFAQRRSSQGAATGRRPLATRLRTRVDDLPSPGAPDRAALQAWETDGGGSFG